MKIVRLIFLLFCTISVSGVPAARGQANYSVVTISEVSLKKDSGEWVRVIAPDKEVDLSREEARVGFFNNQGRVPAGRYVNFKITLHDGGRVTAREDLSSVVYIQKGDFIQVAFDVNREALKNSLMKIEGARLAVGDAVTDFKAGQIQYTGG